MMERERECKNEKICVERCGKSLKEETFESFTVEELRSILEKGSGERDFLRKKIRRLDGIRTHTEILCKDILKLEDNLKKRRCESDSIEINISRIDLSIEKNNRVIDSVRKEYSFLRRSLCSSIRSNSPIMEKKKFSLSFLRSSNNDLKKNGILEFDMKFVGKEGSSGYKIIKKWDEFLTKSTHYPKKELQFWDGEDFMFWLLDLGLFTTCRYFFRVKYKIDSIESLERHKNNIKEELFRRGKSFEHLLLWRGREYLMQCYNNNEKYNSDWGILMRKLSRFPDFYSLIGGEEGLDSSNLDYYDLENLLRYLTEDEEMIRIIRDQGEVLGEELEIRLVVLDSTFVRKNVEGVNECEAMGWEACPPNSDSPPYFIGILIGKWMFSFESCSELVVPTACDSYSILSTKNCWKEYSLRLGSIHVKKYLTCLTRVCKIVHLFNRSPYMKSLRNCVHFVENLSGIFGYDIFSDESTKQRMRGGKISWRNFLGAMKGKGELDFNNCRFVSKIFVNMIKSMKINDEEDF